MNDSAPRLLIGIGILLIVIGGLWLIAGKWVPFGKLPGDISVEKENFKFYFPLGTSLLLSLLLSGMLILLNYFRNR